MTQSSGEFVSLRNKTIKKEFEDSSILERSMCSGRAGRLVSRDIPKTSQMGSDSNQNQDFIEFPLNPNMYPAAQPPQQQLPAFGVVNFLPQGNESTQVKKLTERCQMLEAFCKELLHTNKLLDLENKICIAQITTLNQHDGVQLNNIAGALELLLSKQTHLNELKQRQSKNALNLLRK